MIRPLTAEDSAAALDIWNRGSGRTMTPGIFHEKVWRDPDTSDSLRLADEDATGELTGFAVATRRSTSAGGGSIKLIAVHPDFRRRGVGSRLLERLVGEMRGAGLVSVRLGESPPNYLQPGVDADAQGAIAFFERAGFRRFGTVHDLTVDLAGRDFSTDPTEEELRSGGVVVRRAEDADRGPLDDLLAEQWPAWRAEIGAALERQPPSVHVAVQGHPERRIIAFAAHSANNAEAGWFGPMGTHPDLRGRGAGSVLLKRCLADLAAAGHRTAVIPWVGPVEFYERTVDARVSRTFHRYEKDLSA